MIVILVVLATAAVMLEVEAARPGRIWPVVRGFPFRAVLLNGFQALAVLLASRTWDLWLGSYTLLQGIPYPALEVPCGYLLITFVYYWWHRARHSSPWLWRWVHQIHHSPRRLELVTSFYKHPVEILLNSLLSSVLLHGVLGLSPSGAALTSALTGIAELFYHWNVRTPHWLGYWIQRPESHCVHHAMGRHRMNYSDLPVWDMLFGTFDNPRAEEFECGFASRRERLLLPMLRGVDVNRSIEEAS